MLVVFHLELPCLHYMCAGLSFGAAFSSICIYVSAPIDFEFLAKQADSTMKVQAQGQDAGFRTWTSQQHKYLWPVLRLALGLHFAALAAGMLKMQRLDDNRIALMFGIFETAVILGYQLFLASFAVDDAR